MRALTPFQTIGPFFHGALLRPGSGCIAAPAQSGTRVRVRGHIRDGAGAPVADALLEVWQADPAGRYASSESASESAQRAEGERRVGDARPPWRRDPQDDAPLFSGFGRFGTDAEGAFTIDTVLPGPTPGPDGSTQAPHLLVQIFARGLLSRLVTRIYFEGEALNEKDPILAYVPRERRPTLIAQRHAALEYRLDLVLQGADETVFFDV